MTHMEINEFLDQIEHDYNQSIFSMRQVMAITEYTTAEKAAIAKKIIILADKMKTEMLPWTK